MAKKDVESRSSYDSRYSSRAMTRAAGLDPGSGPGLEEHSDTADCPDDIPSLASMTTDRGEHPSIGSAGAPHVPSFSGGSKNNPNAGK